MNRVAALTEQRKAVEVQLGAEVRKAIDAGKGKLVVALESTIISHGMPYPENLHCARELEGIVRGLGAVPATIAIIEGVPRVGLSDDELVYLAKTGRSVRKVSRRDIAHCVATKETGATTVAGTILLAHMAGITLMATGGIGGVHRGGETSMDVSADLIELGRTPCMVVCAGVKSILDIPRTLEVLETQGVAVSGFQTKEFPAFFTRTSGCEAPMSISSIDDAAKTLLAMGSLGLTSGHVLAVPLPREAEAQGDKIEAAIQQSLAEAHAGKILGREVTPFILKRVNELTRGASLAANLALVKNNTAVAARIAVAASNAAGKA